LAAAANADAQALYRLLRALASVGIFVETTPSHFELTALAKPLLRTAPGSLHDLALLYGDEWLWSVYGAMLYSVRTGLPAFPHVHGQPLFAYLLDHPTAAQSFNGAMNAYSGQEQAAILAAYDFSIATKLVDVGGGQGALLAAILQAHAQLSGILFDLEPVVISAQPLLTGAGVASRCEQVPGDFFVAVPEGGDLYLLKSVIHNWDDGRSVAILRNCRRAIATGGRLLVIERVVPSGNEPAEAKLFDINMLVVLGGQERTATEYAALFQAAGFALSQVIATQSPLSLLEGVAV
jgi:SAM-dependent methyltransferase